MNAHLPAAPCAHAPMRPAAAVTCSHAGGASASAAQPLHYIAELCGESRVRALNQLHLALDLHARQIDMLHDLQALHRRRSTTHVEVERIGTQIANSRDAARRAQAVSRMIRYATRVRASDAVDDVTGQIRRPPKLAAVVDPVNGMYQGFAIYEHRSGDASHGSRFHVYVSDIFTMRMLLPRGTCWSGASVGSHMISLLQRKTDAENEVVVLRALDGDADLERHYGSIGFTARPQAFDNAGLSDSYKLGELLLA